MFTEAEQNFQKALALAPNYHPALLRLGVIRWNQGRFAEAVALAERALTLDPRADWVRRPLAEIYLEVGEVDAARNVLLEAPETVPPAQWSAICLYEQQPAQGIDLRRAEERGFEAIFDADVAVYLLRDAALASDRPAWGRDELLALEHQPTEKSPWVLASVAQLSLAMGERQEAERLARMSLDHQRASNYFRGYQVAYPRAAAHTVLAQNDAAVDLLEKGFASGYRKRWWYAFHRDAVFEPLRGDPRFRALAAKAEAHAAAEREVIRQLRERGQIPKRTMAETAKRGPC